MTKSGERNFSQPWSQRALFEHGLKFIILTRGGRGTNSPPPFGAFSEYLKSSVVLFMN